MKYASRLLEFRELGVLAPLIAFSLFVGITHPVFFSEANILSILREASFLGILAIGMTFVLVGAGIDISVGSVLGLTGAVVALLLVGGTPTVPAALAGIVVGGMAGLVTGAAVVGLRIPSLIASLGMLYIARGVSLLLTGGQPIVGFPDSFLWLGSGTLYGIPIVIVLFAATGVIGYVALNHTRFGFWVKALGGDKESARLAGLPIKRLEIGIYVLSGLMAGFVGVLVLSRLGTAYSQTGRTWELLAIAAVIIGGTSLFGGVGTIIGTIVGAIIIRMLNTSLVILRVDTNWQEIAIGAIIIASVAFDAFYRRRQQQMQARRAIEARELGSKSAGDEGVTRIHRSEVHDLATRPVVLRLSKVSKYFGFVRALDDVDLELRQGEVLALVGDNGAGKSTLIKIAAGALQADEGDMEVNGEEVRFTGPKGAILAGVATVHQRLALVDSLDVTSNLYLGREPTRAALVDKSRMYTEAQGLLDSLRIRIPSLRVPIGDLSGGQRQVVAIARAVSLGGRILILDEPTAAIGVEQQARVLDLINELRAQGTSVILISHNLRQVYAVADRILVLRNGRNAGTFDPRDTDPDRVVGAITGTDSL